MMEYRKGEGKARTWRLGEWVEDVEGNEWMVWERVMGGREGFVWFGPSEEMNVVRALKLLKGEGC